MLDDTTSNLQQYLNALRADGFGGDIADDQAARLVGATDNSIYHIAPQAILFPRGTADVACAATLADRFSIALTARGGGTGTNGQSLNDGVVIDMSRYMTDILSLDTDAGTVTVEPGVVLDQLNANLRPHGYFFAPAVSTSSRATVGGMFATDASGKGSRIYGRMSDHVLTADIILANGRGVSVATHGSLDEELGRIATAIHDDLDSHAQEIARRFPVMNRGLTGYNLDEARGDAGDLNFIKLLAGSEGTLAVTTGLTLRITPIPKTRALTVLAYDNCVAALDHVPFLIKSEPAAIEFLDDKILALAAASPMWSEVESVLGQIGDAGGFLFVEFTGDSDDEVRAGQDRLAHILDQSHIPLTAQVTTAEPTEMSALWEMRKRSVGLLAAVETSRIGLPFVEDAAVPPENLSAFVSEFGQLLGSRGLTYGMFGHADVGCVHVRPMLNMRDPADRDQIRPISDAVSALCQKHGGLIWGEHGKGMRGEYVETYVGPDLYAVMRRIKAAFDPDNRLNPGKLVTADGSDLAVMKLDAAPMRGARDAQIDETAYADFDRAIACNGNGACHNWAFNDPMCPSYKATRDKIQAPKGRASLFREWARLRSTDQDVGPVEEALKASLDTCLSCKSCTGQCPVRVDIPAMKSAFLHAYFKSRARPARDHLLRHMEGLSLALRKLPRLANLALGNPLTRAVLSRGFGLVDIPTYAPLTAEQAVHQGGGRLIDTANPPSDWGHRPVVLVLDSFTGAFDTNVISQSATLLDRLGFTVWATRPMASGKARQVRGMLDAFEAQRDRTGALLSRIKVDALPLISLEPAVTDLLNKDYDLGTRTILSLDRFLSDNLNLLPQLPADSDLRFTLFSHCTEKTADPATLRRWQAVFRHFGLTLEIANTGCCGMAGLFGHEAEHRDMSSDLFDLSWRAPLKTAGAGALATGFSCRSQAGRFGSAKPAHPCAALLARLEP
ncbi:FAD-binding and (Fe-S)-binding domain-containing protein [Ruegeria sp. Ofav3-42]|uniref:FAD-binding and (Fe-S)-binding domain-containing protein n=1 Tax=Ruegeria sp. Ofav3-42 TaxID=2917759 RepID=UPI001EF547C2|nr:FAD-binding and (Fe-S)-binding domain-containing protein [Ruegeria sp. Ofav3-42]MCG7521426.1 FAD-binding oxidoreductase [Ruegeria sp. Ofav3-42]